MSRKERNDPKSYDDESYLKIMIAGEADVGKTALANRYSTGEYSHPETIGIDFSSKSELGGSGRFKFSILDMAGEARFRFILPEVCKGAKGIMLLFDLSNQKSFSNLGEWVDLIRESLGNVPILLVGSKSDLESKVSEKRVKEFVSSKRLGGYMRVSAKLNRNVDEAFRKMTELIQKPSE